MKRRVISGSETSITGSTIIDDGKGAEIRDCRGSAGMDRGVTGIHELLNMVFSKEKEQ